MDAHGKTEEEIRNGKEKRKKKNPVIAVAAKVEKNLVHLVLRRVQNVVAAKWRRKTKALIKEYVLQKIHNHGKQRNRNERKQRIMATTIGGKISRYSSLNPNARNRVKPNPSSLYSILCVSLYLR
ncbi:unnamed protein product [Sphenostylis stenocarpa]|uniref:Uncharacterized protein n=1 Tax=Sphenostylis stenocarpa TaxID=92480 RepID=A0AA86V857_9FABA|nr:unnamed protein product [Sphenostylis stenocarpa]